MSNEVNPDILVSRAKAGDLSAFEELVSLHEKKVYNLAFRYTNNREDALDISQEVFLRVYKSLGSFKEESSFSTWLYQIAVNSAIDAVRRQSRHKTISMTKEDESEEYEFADTEYSPDDFIDRAALRENIKKALTYLSHEHRTILILRDVNGMSYDEIGSILKLEPSTVKSRLFRAREKLRSVLTPDGNIYENTSSKKMKRR